MAEHLELKETRPCRFANRTTSLVGVEETMLVTPAVNGWGLAFGEWPRLADEVRLRVELASLEFGEAQAFASDDASGRRAWLRAVDGEWVRALVFDGEGDPPRDEDVHQMARAWSIDPRAVDFLEPGILGKRDITIRLPKEEDESGADFFGRTVEVRPHARGRELGSVYYGLRLRAPAP